MARWTRIVAEIGLEAQRQERPRTCRASAGPEGFLGLSDILSDNPSERPTKPRSVRLDRGKRLGHVHDDLAASYPLGCIISVAATL